MNKETFNKKVKACDCRNDSEIHVIDVTNSAQVCATYQEFANELNKTLGDREVWTWDDTWKLEKCRLMVSCTGWKKKGVKK